MGWLLFISQQRPREIIWWKKATHILVSFTDTQRYQLVNEFYTVLYNIRKDER